MKTSKYKRPVVPLIISIIPFLFLLFYGTPLPAQEIPSPPRNIKGFFELDISTSISTRTVFEETRPGVNFEGDAVSTRVMARIATKPLSPVEFYLQAGMANLDIDEFDDFRGDYGFAYGGGIALRLYEYKGPNRFQMILRGDTLTFTTEDEVLTGIGGMDALVKEEIRWQEYTIDGVGIWRSQYWEPYLGVRFSWLNSTDTIKDPRVGRIDLEEDSNLGLILGTNLYFDPRENFALNLEATLIDQASLKIGLKLWY